MVMRRRNPNQSERHKEGKIINAKLSDCAEQFHGVKSQQGEDIMLESHLTGD
jgi:hypothetical protein